MKKEDRIVRGITSADVDPQGNVTLWDHGPTEPGPLVEKDSDEYKRLEAEAKAWHQANGDNAVPIVMGQGDANHAMAVEPYRYSLDPDVPEGEIAAEMKAIAAQRAKDKEVADKRAADAQAMADRKQAIGIVLAKRREANRFRVEQQRLSDEQAERDRKAAAAKAAEQKVT